MQLLHTRKEYMDMHLVSFMTIILLLSAPLIGIGINTLIRYSIREEKLRKELLDNWKTARENRQAWYEQYGSKYNFYDPE